MTLSNAARAEIAESSHRLVSFSAISAIFAFKTSGAPAG
jgi:hypothetical protein